MSDTETSASDTRVDDTAEQNAPQSRAVPSPDCGAAAKQGTRREDTPALKREDTPALIEATTDPKELQCRVEAALMTTDRPTTAAKLADLLGKVSAKAIGEAVTALNAIYEKSGRTFRIEEVAGGYQILTLPAYADVLAAMHRTRQQSKLTPAQLETLAIVAYKQPVLRADVEAIRGVACGEVLRSLMDRRLVKIVGRAEELGRPMLYGTTKTFLELFGLASLKDLPKAEELKPKG